MSVTRSHSLSIGIVGLPNSGKSTLFNALTQNSVPAENYPFCTIDRNVGVVEIPDDRLSRLAKVLMSKKIVPSAMTFVDIAGLVKGASKGEGLGNKFLGHIKEVDAVMYVLRSFKSEKITHVYNRVSPVDDFKILESELIFKDIETVEQRMKVAETRGKSKKDPKIDDEKKVLEKVYEWLNSGNPVRSLPLNEEELKYVTDMWLLTSKPSFYALNVRSGIDDDLIKEWRKDLSAVVPEDEVSFMIEIDSKTEGEMGDLSEEEREQLTGMVTGYRGVDDVIDIAYRRLDLLTFYTGNEKEVNAWTIKNGASVRDAAGVIHTDLMEQFVAAEIVTVEALIEVGGWLAAKEKGLMKNVGRDYIVQDGDCVHVLAH